MSKFNATIAPGHTLEVPYLIGVLGTLTYFITSDGPVDSFLVDLSNKVAYFAGQSFVYLGEFKSGLTHFHQVQLPHVGEWFVLIRNSTNQFFHAQWEASFTTFPYPYTPTGSIKVRTPNQLSKFAQESKKLAPSSLRDAESIIDNIYSLGINALTSPACFWSDDGSLVVEWILEERRIGLFFADNAEDSGWFYTDHRPGKMTNQRGQLGSFDAKRLVGSAFE